MKEDHRRVYYLSKSRSLGRGSGPTSIEMIDRYNISVSNNKQPNKQSILWSEEL